MLYTYLSDLTAMGKKTTAELALDLGRCMTEMKNFVRRHIQAKIKEQQIDITFEMLEIMACLWARDGMNQQEIADLSVKDKSSITYLINHLVKRDMVRRVADLQDRRNNLICLTRKGKLLQNKLHPFVLEMYDEAAVGAQPLEIRNSINLIRKMTQNLKENKCIVPI